MVQDAVLSGSSLGMSLYSLMGQSCEKEIRSIGFFLGASRVSVQYFGIQNKLHSLC